HARGIAHQELDRWDKALADFAKAAELKPTEPVYFKRLAVARAHLGQWEKAGASFEHVLTLKPDDADSWNGLALLELRRGPPAVCRKLCTRLPERPAPAATHDSYASAWAWALAPDAVADWTKPLTVAGKAQTGSKGNYDSLHLAGALLYRAGRFHEAVQ